MNKVITCLECDEPMPTVGQLCKRCERECPEFAGVKGHERWMDLVAKNATCPATAPSEWWGTRP